MDDKEGDMNPVLEAGKQKNIDNDHNNRSHIISCDKKSTQHWKESDRESEKIKNQNRYMNSNQKVLAFARPSNESASRMFMLNIDCFEELFEWLSINDLFALRRTCKRMKKLIDYYIKTNYPTIRKLHLNSKTFNELLWMNFDLITLISEIHVTIRPEFDATQFELIKNFLNKIEYVYISGWKSEPNIYEVFLKYCNNMKLLLFENFLTIGYVIINNEWLKHRYPLLEYVHIENMPRNEIDEFVRFFQLNPNIHALSVDFNLLVDNALRLLAAGIKFERLYIFMLNRDQTNLLGRLYDDGFYKRLNVADNLAVNKEIWNIPATGTQSLHLHRLYFTIPPLPNLKELRIVNPRTFDEKYEHVKNTVERIYIGTNIPVNMERYKTTFEQTTGFIRNCPKLKHFMISHMVNENLLDLFALNKERKKLAGACKTTIYVDEKVFIATKWATEKTNYDLIELKRLESREWALNFENDPCDSCLQNSKK